MQFKSDNCAGPRLKAMSSWDSWTKRSRGAEGWSAAYPAKIAYGKGPGGAPGLTQPPWTQHPGEGSGWSVIKEILGDTKLPLWDSHQEVFNPAWTPETSGLADKIISNTYKELNRSKDLYKEDRKKREKDPSLAPAH